MDNAMTISIQDDFDLRKIADSGQCFRWEEKDGTFRFIHQVRYLEICPSDIDALGTGTYTVSCDEAEWNGIWRDYFDLDRNYAEIRQNCKCTEPFLAKAIEAGAGIRILHQDPWEMLVTFIISQRKNIPAIRRSVQLLAARYGNRIDENSYSFPTPEELRDVTIEDLKECSLGYRAPYVRCAIDRVLDGRLDLKKLADLSNDDLFSALLQVEGVGVKVANCVCLFGFGRTSRAPVDVWISRAIELCGGIDPFPAFGDAAGIIQQYVFYYMKTRGTI